MTKTAKNTATEAEPRGRLLFEGLWARGLPYMELTCQPQGKQTFLISGHLANLEHALWLTALPHARAFLERDKAQIAALLPILQIRTLPMPILLFLLHRRQWEPRHAGKRLLSTYLVPVEPLPSFKGFGAGPYLCEEGIRDEALCVVSEADAASAWVGTFYELMRAGHLQKEGQRLVNLAWPAD